MVVVAPPPSEPEPKKKLVPHLPDDAVIVTCGVCGKPIQVEGEVVRLDPRDHGCEGLEAYEFHLQTENGGMTGSFIGGARAKLPDWVKP